MTDMQLLCKLVSIRLPLTISLLLGNAVYTFDIAAGLQESYSDLMETLSNLMLFSTTMFGYTTFGAEDDPEDVPILSAFGMYNDGELWQPIESDLVKKVMHETLVPQGTSAPNLLFTTLDRI